MSQTYNFSAGPSTLPKAVLERAQTEMLDWNNTGRSVMEMSHRSAEFISIAEQTEADLRQLMVISDAYKVLFLQGGASTQFAAIPLNLMQGKTGASYINTGAWSKKAIAEAQKLSAVQISASSADDHFTTIPAPDSWDIDPNNAYLHYTANETIGGVEFDSIPDSKGLPLVSDISSNILSRPLDINRFGLVYAGAQKNMGPSGITVVIVHEDLIGHAAANTPSMLDYKTHADNGSMYNTPPTYNWYLLGLVLKWVQDKGGVEAMKIMNQRKASKLYAAIDNSSFYSNPVDINCRSRMNVPFILADASLDSSFLSTAKEAGLTDLKGHRSVGGMRASIYNAMPEAGVDTLIDFMKEFERVNG